MSLPLVPSQGGRGGHVDAAWYDWRDDVAFNPAPKPENALQHVYYTSSTDGGRTWSPNIRITDRAIDRRLSDVWQNGVHGPVGLASTNEIAYIAWDDSRNAVGESKAQDVYFTRVHVDGGAIDFGGTDDVSTGTKLQWTGFGLGVGLGLCGLALLLAKRAAAPA